MSKKKPELIEDSKLDDVTGGLLPAVQKVREAAVRSTTASTPTTTTIGVGELKGADGSV